MKDFSEAQGLPEVGVVQAHDQMDDGSPICLSVTVDRRDGSAAFDFAGTGPEVYGNTNAPPAVTYSAIIYALRCMVKQDIPLNQVPFLPLSEILLLSTALPSLSLSLSLARARASASA